jgi:hypothetical protein
MLEEFRDTYGMRFVGLADPGSGVYQDYRVPDPEAPYPQDFVIDQDGIVRYWSWEYDPQEVIAAINGLLGATGITAPDGAESPGERRLGLRLSATPNPFRSATEIQFRLPDQASIHLAVYDVIGRRVRTLAAGPRAAGPHTVGWGGRDASGLPLATGIYFIELSTGDASGARHVRDTRRVVLLR